MSVEDNKDAVILSLPENEMVSVTEICRLCANQSDKLVPIYSDEGLSNDLGSKINSYLPINVSDRDELPLQCCWGCASTLLAWHELVLASVEADRRLRSYQFITTTCSPLDETHTDVGGETSSDNDKFKETASDVTSSLNVFCQTQVPTEIDVESDKIKKIHSPVYFTTSDASGVVDNFDNYIDLQHPFIAETSIQDDQNIIPFKDEELEEIEAKPFEDAEFQQFTQTTNESTETAAENDDEEYNYACHVCHSLFIKKDDIVKHYQDAHPTESIQDADEREKEVSKAHTKSKRKHTKIDQKMVNDAVVFANGRMYYKCRQCGKSLHSPYTYMWHIRIHTGERPYVCDLCGKQFRVSQGLIRHVRETHEGIKNFPCDICGRMFATRRNVEEHRHIHTNERPYICATCGKTFKQKASLFVHNRSHNDSFPFKCSYCNQGFRTRPPLLLHMTRHTGEKPYPCDVCGRRFRIKYELKRHKLIHSDEKPFTCNYCGLAFRQKRYLKNHLKLNHNGALKCE